MEQYMPKAAVLAEIERRIKTNKECMLGLRNLDYYQGKVDALNDAISFLDTLEVKGVTIDEEIEKCLKKYHMLAVGKKDFAEIARHFFELGMAASNKARKGE